MYNSLNDTELSGNFHRVFVENEEEPWNVSVIGIVVVKLY